MNRLVWLAAMLGWICAAQAQAPAPVSEKDFLGDMPMVLSVSRLPQRLDDTPGAVTIIDRDMIRLSGARDVADLMRWVPGFQTSNAFELVAPQASYHGAFGAYSNHIQVLVDGRSAYSAYFIGSVEAGLQTVALQDIERIEVLRGSNSAAYGARAFLGVINIVTRHPAETQGVQAGLASGENGVRDARASFGWSTENAMFRIGADRRADDGLTGSNGQNQVERLNFRADWQLGAGDQAQLRMGGLKVGAGKGFAGIVDEPLRDSSLASGYLQFDWQHSLGEDADLALSVSHMQEIYRDRYPYSLIPFGIDASINVDAGGRASNDTLSLQHTFRQGPNLRVVWGSELRREQVLSRPLYNTDAALVTDFARLFFNTEWHVVPDWVLNTGLMSEHSSVTGNRVAPRLALNWHFAEGQTLRGGVSRAFRPPSAFEKYGDVRYFWNSQLLKVSLLASGKVEPETVRAGELGYLADFPKLGLNLDVRAFHEQVSGFITQLNTTRPKDYANTENFSIHGLEYQLKWRPWRGAQLVFNQAYMNLSLIDHGIEKGVRVDYGNALPAPVLASTLSYFQKLPGGLDLSLMHQDSGTMTPQGTGPDHKKAMTRTDLRLGAPVRLGGNRGEIALVVQNLGAPYPDFLPAFQFQRRAFVTLRVEN